MKKSLIYTRGGDKGRTSLADGSRIAKDDIRLESYGTIDELSAHLGLLATQVATPHDQAFLQAIQNVLFCVGACLSTPSDKPAPAGCAVAPEQVAQLEAEIDAIDATLPPLHAFVLSGGSPSAAEAHVSRTVCRRAERAIVTLDRQQPVAPDLLRYVNRLSDYLFVLARQENHRTSTPEIFWQR